jgi:multiple sugar transport system ATP-binding protein
MNFVEGTLDGGAVRIGDQQLEIDQREREHHGGLTGGDGRGVIVGVRPEHLDDAALATAGSGRRLNGLVRLTELLGSEVVVHFQIEAAPAVTPELQELAEDVDEAVLLDELEHHRRIRRTAFVGRFDAATRVTEDAVAEIAVAPGALRFFDPETGEALRG